MEPDCVVRKTNYKAAKYKVSSPDSVCSAYLTINNYLYLLNHIEDESIRQKLLKAQKEDE